MHPDATQNVTRFCNQHFHSSPSDFSSEKNFTPAKKKNSFLTIHSFNRQSAKTQTLERHTILKANPAFFKACPSSIKKIPAKQHSFIASKTLCELLSIFRKRIIGILSVSTRFIFWQRINFPKLLHCSPLHVR